MVLCDLDGVVWRGAEPIPGAAATLSALSGAGATVIFVTNNSNRPVSHYESRLEALGLEAVGRVATSALAAATVIDGSSHTMVCAGPGVIEALERDGRPWIGADVHPDDHPVEIGHVVVGLHHDFDYHRLHHAAEAIRRGARLIGTNTDATFPTPHGEQPGGGSLLAAVATASGARPTIAGKPQSPMVDLVRSMVRATIGGDRDNADLEMASAIMIGDRSSTDGEFARRLGIPFAYITGGVRGDMPAEPPAIEGDSLEAMFPHLMERLTDGPRAR